MANAFQVVIDAADPRALGECWAVALGYVEQPPPPGFDTWDDALDAFGIDRSDPNRAYGIVDPDGAGPRLFFIKVSEDKTAKNRVHLDVHVGTEQIRAKADELIALGAIEVGSFEEPEGTWITLLDPEGNEFCVN